MTPAADVRLALTLGDPAGIGPEITAAALHDLQRHAPGVEVVVIGGAAVLCAAGIAAQPGCDLLPLDDPFDPHRDPIGEATAASGGAAAAALLAGIDLALRGAVDGLVTAPLSKEAVHLAGYPWPGQTEVLIERSGVARGVMLFVGGGLRVAIATRHMALRDVPERLSIAGLAADLELLAEALCRDFGLAAPRIGVCGLNPHAGEAGLFGDEERRIVVPAMDRVSGPGRLIGPLPADTAFVKHRRGELDAVMAMYHDQGLIPMKVLSFGGGVNVTLGLPFVRTSPDHGTAYDIAGKGRAEASSYLEALRLAAELVRNRRILG